jgi:hypothetical protein
MQTDSYIITKFKDASMDCDSCTYRRVAVVEIKHGGGDRLTGDKLLAVNTTRVPISFVDINTRTGKIVNIVKVKKATAWENVPTPSI